VPNNNFDDLFDAWGAALNVNPQLGKTVFHLESNGNPGSADSSQGAVGPMQILPSTAAEVAKRMGFDPKAVNLHDMRWAVPLSMAYLAEGLTATQSAEGALAYYHGGPDRAQWGPKTQAYVQKGLALYPKMALTPAQEAQQVAEAPQPTQAASK
jgi:soluble lytic murein transglycosylase-like protein